MSGMVTAVERAGNAARVESYPTDLRGPCFLILGLAGWRPPIRAGRGPASRVDAPARMELGQDSLEACGRATYTCKTGEQIRRSVGPPPSLARPELSTQ